MKQAMEFAKNVGLTEKARSDWGAWRTDRSVVCCFRAKGEIGTALDTFETAENIPDVAPIKDQLNAQGKRVRISAEYLKHLLKLLTRSKDIETVEIQVDNDYP